MPGWKRSLANFIGKVLGAELVSRKGIRQGDVFVTNSADIPLSLERCHLRRFFQHFEVDCIFDVGANAGQYAELARSLGFTGPIISYEPIPAVARELRRKAKRDGNWYVEELALDDAERQATFHVMAGSQFSSLKLPSEAETDRFDKQNIVTEEVSLTTARLADQYDDYVRRLGFRRPFLKMDTQGNDLAVARGAGDRLQHFVGLQSELAFKRIYDDQSGYRAALDYYLSQGFELSALVPNNRGHFPDLIEMDCILYNALPYSAEP
jgi:FkbM family methyltransferase